MNYMKYIEKYDLHFQLYINEIIDLPIYKTSELTEKVGNISDFKNEFLNVRKTRLINDKFYYYISFKSDVLGWVEHRNILRVFQIKMSEIKLDESVNLDNKLNNIFDIDQELLQKNKIKILKTKFIVEDNDTIYISLYLKNKLIGFAPINKTYCFISLKKECKFIKEKITLYKDSKLTKPLANNSQYSTKSYMLLGAFESSDAARILFEGKRYWVHLKDIGISPFSKKNMSAQEIVIDALLYQLNDKLEKQLEFSAKKISDFETENKNLRTREKEYRTHLSKIKKLL